MNWAEMKAAALAGVRATYEAELERLAESLRPRFESGELGDWADGGEDPAPTNRLEEIVREHFGLGDDWAGGYLLVCASWWGRVMDDAGGWAAPEAWACAAIGQDLIDLASRRGVDQAERADALDLAGRGRGAEVGAMIATDPKLQEATADAKRVAELFIGFLGENPDPKDLAEAAADLSAHARRVVRAVRSLARAA